MVSVVGGDIEIAGNRNDGDPATLAAPSGQLRLVSVASPGETASQPSMARPVVAVEGFARLGTITMIDDALVDVSGDGGGRVQIRGRALNADGSQLRADTEGAMPGGRIDVQVKTFMITSGGTLSVNMLSPSTGTAVGGEVSIVATDQVTLTGRNNSIESFTNSSRHAGPIELTTGRLTLTDNSKITSATSAISGGNAGQVTVRANRIEMTGNGTRINSVTRGSGDSGLVRIETEHLQVTRGRIQGGAFAGSTGNAGTLDITATTTVVEEGGRIGTGLAGEGAGGRIDLHVHELMVRSGGRVTTSSTADSIDDVFVGGDAGQVTITATGRVQVAGEGSLIISSTASTGNAGQITIHAPEITVLDHGQISTQTETLGHAGEIALRADQLRVTRGGQITSSSIGQATGNAGRIDVDVATLSVTDGGRISVNVLDNSTGMGGSVSITATDQVTVTGNGSAIESLTAGSGNAGQIGIATNQLTLTSSSKITSATSAGSSGDAGQITIRADRIEMTGSDTRINSITRGSGNSGLVRIETAHLQITQGRIQGGVFAGSTGNAGELRITATTAIVESGGRIGTGLAGVGEGGRIDLQVHDLIVRSGGRVTSSADADSLGVGFTSGDAGRLTIHATGRVLISGADSVISSLTSGTGNGGQVTIHTDQLTVADNGQMSTETRTSGNAGDITVQANDIILEDQGVITTRSSSPNDLAGAGGTIRLVAQNTIRLRDSEITTSVVGGEKRGGNIDVRSDVGVLERSQIRADAFGGPGGNVVIQTEGLISDVASEVTASSTLSVDGTVTVEGVTDLSGTLVPIDTGFINAGVFSGDRCVGRRRGLGISRFILAGRERVPLEPHHVLPSPGLGDALTPQMAGRVLPHISHRGRVPRNASDRASWVTGADPIPSTVLRLASLCRSPKRPMILLDSRR